MRLKMTPKKVGVELQEFNKRRLDSTFACWEFTEKKEVSHLLGLRGKHQFSDQRSSRIRASCVASTVAGAEG